MIDRSQQEANPDSQYCGPRLQHMESSSYKNHGEESWLLVLDPVPIRLSLPLPFQRTQPFCFQAIPRSFAKAPRSGSAPLSATRPSNRDDYGVLVHERPLTIATSRPWCNNWQGTRILRDPGKQRRGPRCIRILSGHREPFDDVPGYTPTRSESQVVPGSSVPTLDRSRVARVTHLHRMVGSIGSERPAVSDWASALSWGRDEADLVHELQAGSETAFDWLVTHYHGPVYNLILGMLGDTSDAADGTQEVFLKAFRGIRNFRQGSSLKTWLYRIAIREALNHKRWFKRHVQKNVSIDAEPEEGQAKIEVEDLGATPFEQLAALEIQVAVHGALQQIPDVFRSAVILRDLEGLSYEEVAEVLECSVGTVKSRILRGRRALKEILEPLLGGHQIRGCHPPTYSHGNVSEAQPSPFGDAFSAARRITVSSQCTSPRASSTGKGVQ